MNDQSVSADSIVTWLDEHPTVLLLSHVRPDGDAYGSLFGLHAALLAAGRRSSLYLSNPLPTRYGPIFPQLQGVFVSEDVAAARRPALALLDVTHWQRTDRPGDLTGDGPAVPACLVDHHPDNARFVEPTWVDPAKCSTSQMVLDLLRSGEFEITADCATCLLVGMVMDTGGFRFPNTDARSLRDAASLVDAGARYADAMEALFMAETYARKRLEARLIADATFARERRLVYARLTQEMLTQEGVGPEDTEGLIDVLKGIRGVDIACLIQPEPGRVRFSFRAKTPEYPVDGIAHALGGGGHLLAAGAAVDGIAADEAERLFLDLAGKVLRA